MTTFNRETIQSRYEVLLHAITRILKPLNDRFYDEHEIRMKDGNDPVTEVDLEIDKLVTETLRAKAGDDLILTEETSDGDFSKYRDHEAVWIVDPLDGTKNFLRGITNYACGIGFVSKGQPLLGAIALPDGSFHLANVFLPSEKRVSQTSSVDQAMIGMDFPKKAADRWLGAKIATRVLKGGVSGFRSMGSAVADFRRVADRQLDAYIHTNLSPWDVAAPAAFVLAAGGRITRLNGRPWNVFCPDVLATNGHLHNDLLKLING